MKLLNGGQGEPLLNHNFEERIASSEWFGLKNLYGIRNRNPREKNTILKSTKSPEPTVWSKSDSAG
jgi:hypothetical protein